MPNFYNRLMSYLLLHYPGRLSGSTVFVVIYQIFTLMIAGAQVVPLDKTTGPIQITYDQTIRFRIKRNALIPEELAPNMRGIP